MTGGVRKNYTEYAKTRLGTLRNRNQHFSPTSIFGDPAWEIILEALIAGNESRGVPLSDLARDMRKPVAIISRLVNIMEAEGHIECLGSIDRPEQAWVRLTPDTVTKCENFLEREMGEGDFCNN